MELIKRFPQSPCNILPDFLLPPVSICPRFLLGQCILGKWLNVDGQELKINLHYTPQFLSPVDLCLPRFLVSAIDKE